MNYYTDVLKKYTEFSGRATRKEYWMFTLWNTIIMIVIAIIESILARATGTGLFLLLLWIYVIAIFLPTLGVTLRRLRDAGFSPWWVLLDLVPYIGWVAVLIMLVMPTKQAATRLCHHRPL